MTRIGLLSDTHHFLDDSLFEHFKNCDEIWHAGDFGQAELADALEAFRPLRGVYGNIDGKDIRSRFPESLHFTCEKVQVFMKHIGGYPKRYAPGVKDAIRQHGTRLFISGHSHILKIIYDAELHCLHMNPGAAGKQGWQKVRTAIRFVIDDSDIRDCEVIELSTPKI
ncbi:MAG TPA: metallophosphoesterase family protein [Ferruginibacter sp.]|nr:metallophosphoesterase family protein [Ferruginibacter sp.]HRO18278.1 metallophosphoesterase family protein [Ferruginibacter sp.]HRQ20843.1 metallophosphoesterase family protein [Ferruginibacter sp.]